MNQNNNNIGKEHFVTITVNNKPVKVMGPKATGLEIKQSAINDGVSITIDFVLSQELPNGNLKRIGDDDVVTVNSQSTFSVVSPDHNS